MSIKEASLLTERITPFIMPTKGSLRPKSDVRVIKFTFKIPLQIPEIFRKLASCRSAPPYYLYSCLPYILLNHLLFPLKPTDSESLQSRLQLQMPLQERILRHPDSLLFRPSQLLG